MGEEEAEINSNFEDVADSTAVRNEVETSNDEAADHEGLEADDERPTRSKTMSKGEEVSKSKHEQASLENEDAGHRKSRPIMVKEDSDEEQENVDNSEEDL